MTTSRSSLWCAGCGHDVAPSAPLPFRCARATEDDDVDHVIARRGPPAGATWPDATDPNPFVRFRSLLYSWQVARARGMDDDAYVAAVRELDAAVAAIDGGGFTHTPHVHVPALAERLGLGDGGLWVKDETGHVSGSHKARHLMGVALYLRVAQQTGLLSSADAARPLAIASCGNAALAAAIVARAAGRALRVFIPTWAAPGVVDQLDALGATLHVCERRPGDPPGDPCYRQFRRSVEDGALPFTCQGNENGLTIEGGMTLGWELAAQHRATGKPLDRLIVQVGGGALASACVQALRWAQALGAIDRLPAIHAVQTEACPPLIRAWRRVAEDAARRLRAAGLTPPIDPSDRELATWLHAYRDAPQMRDALDHAAGHRSAYMWPIERAPHSVACGILDDETYDWMQVVRGMIDTGGWPVLTDEETLVQAREDAHAHAEISADATGTAGLAGAMTLRASGALTAGEHVAVLFTGARR